MTVIVENLPALQRDFADLTAKMQRQVLRAALQKSARLVARSAKQKVPRRTGALQKAIGTRTSVRSATAESTIGFNRKAFYGRFIELGTSKMAAKPFLRPALDENQRQIVDTFIESINEGVEKRSRGIVFGFTDEVIFDG